MAKCANNKCNKEVVSIKGKRVRKTCSNSCRQLFWQQRLAKSKLSKVVILNNEEWNEFLKTCKIEDLAFSKNINNITSVSVSDEMGNVTTFEKYDDRTNPLINSARGRDECGINLDEIDNVATFKDNVDK